LNHLTKKGVEWVWGQEQEQAFVKLKQALTSDEILAYGSEEGTLVLRTDASGVGVGGVLLLRTNDNHDRPVCYFSQTLTDVQRRWSTYEQELYAILVGMTKEPYSTLLKMKEFLVETDHRNLTFLQKIASDTGNRKLNRWLMIMMEFTFTIHHVAGAANSIADVLSRFGHPPNNSINVINLVSSQGSQPHSSFTQKLVEEQEKQSADWKKTRTRDSVSGIWKNNDGTVTIPKEAKSLWIEVISSAHGTPFTGHMGCKKTLDNIRSAGFVWDRMDKDIGQFVKSCGTCQKIRLRRQIEYELKTTAVYTPFHTLCVDTIGPFMQDKETGCIYIEVMQDAASKNTELAPTVTVDGATAADGIVSHVFLRYGLPCVLRSDNGSQFVNATIDSLLQKLHVKHHTITEYHPEANGIVERVNEEVLRHLRCLTLDFSTRDDWVRLLPMIQFIVNNTVNSSTGKTPYEILYGDHLSPSKDLPSLILEGEEGNVRIEFPDEEYRDNDKWSSYVSELQNRLGVIRQEAKLCQEAAVQARLDKHNKDIKPHVFKNGDYVLLYPSHDVKLNKLAPRLQGPFKVIGHPSDVVYEIQSIVDPRCVMRVHPERMSPFYLPDDIKKAELEKLAESDEPEFKVKAIIEHQGHGKRTKFLVHWDGYDNEEDYTWEPYDHVKDVDKFQEYMNTHPDLMKIFSKEG